MRGRSNHLEVLTRALLSGSWTKPAVAKRVRKLLGPDNARHAASLTREIFDAWRAPYAPSHRRLRTTIASTETLGLLAKSTIGRIRSTSVATPTPRFEPIASLKDHPIPHLASDGDVARWLGIAIEHVEWFADKHRTLEYDHAGTLGHYGYQWREKRSGGWRLIEAPKPRLKLLQHRILEEVLNRLAPHDAAYGFVPARSCAQAAAKHAGEHVVVTVDLRDFFLTTPLRRAYAAFRCLGYPHKVAQTLTGLCSTSTPRQVTAEHFGYELISRYRARHLPQGAPTSPALANLAALGLDKRLSGLARTFEARYTRYADDLTFSGDADFERRLPSFLKTADAIVRDEGYALNPAKTRIMPHHARQTVTGIVVNDHINVARPDFDALKATLTNCVRLGAASQNRASHTDFRAHLDGRIAWVERLNLRRGEKLRRLFDAIDW